MVSRPCVAPSKCARDFQATISLTRAIPKALNSNHSSTLRLYRIMSEEPAKDAYVDLRIRSL